MMETTIEKREAVLAYCQEVCPNTSTGYTDLVDLSLHKATTDGVWTFSMFNEFRFLIHKDMPDADTRCAYAYLGLETRAAVEAERAKIMGIEFATYEEFKDRLKKAVREDDYTMAELSVMLVQVQILMEHNVLKAKSAKLAEALETIQTDIRNLGSGYDEMDTFISKTRGGVSDALAAQGKGESNGE